MNIEHKHACEDWQDVLVDLLFGDADEAARSAFADHAADCEACAQELHSLQQTLGLASERTTFEPSDAELADFETRVLAQTVHASPATRPARSAASERSPRPANIYRLPTWTRQLATAAAVLIVGVFIGRSFPGQDAPQQAEIGSSESLQLVSATEERAHAYLNRSKTLLLGVVNFDAETDDPAALALPQRGEIAEELLLEANYLKTNLSDAEQQQLKSLVTELEVILLQLAHLEAQADVPEIEIVQAGVDRSGLLFKIDVEKMRHLEEVSKPATDQRPKAAV